jgi:ligand-binding sensor protein
LGEEPSPQEKANVSDEAVEEFPIACFEKVQGIFAGILGIGAAMVSLNGDLLTEVHYSNPFCALVHSSPSGLNACRESWRRIALKNSNRARFETCHAGLCYLRTGVQDNFRMVAWLIAGQFICSKPNSIVRQRQLQQLAEEHNLPSEKLIEAAKAIPVLKRHQQDQVIEWSPRVAATFQSILCERAQLMNRLQRIAEISTVTSPLKPISNP